MGGGHNEPATRERRRLSKKAGQVGLGRNVERGVRLIESSPIGFFA